MQNPYGCPVDPLYNRSHPRIQAYRIDITGLKVNCLLQTRLDRNGVVIVQCRPSILLTCWHQGMDFRFAGFIFASLLAHLALLIAGADPLTPKIGGEAATLSVTLVTNLHLDSAAPAAQLPNPAARTHPGAATSDAITPRAVSTQLRRPAVVERPTRPDVRSPAQHKESVVTAAATAPPAQHVSEQISAALQNQLVEQFSYPWLARKRGWQGRVMLSLHIGKDGDLSRWKIARTSGYRVLDRSALDSARRIRNLPQAATWLNGAALDLLVPVHYRLLDS
jgi:protein TonB